MHPHALARALINPPWDLGTTAAGTKWPLTDWRLYTSSRLHWARQTPCNKCIIVTSASHKGQWGAARKAPTACSASGAQACGGARTTLRAGNKCCHSWPAPIGLGAYRVWGRNGSEEEGPGPGLRLGGCLRVDAGSPEPAAQSKRPARLAADPKARQIATWRRQPSAAISQCWWRCLAHLQAANSGGELLAKSRRTCCDDRQAGPLFSRLTEASLTGL